jgi:hypothetical protein
MDENPPGNEMPELELHELPQTYYAEPVKPKGRQRHPKQRRKILSLVPRVRKDKPKNRRS